MRAIQNNAESIIVVRDLFFEYPDGTQALNGISIKILGRRITVLLGPNGSGKSTLLLALAGLLKPKKGIILYKNTPIWKIGSEIRRYMGIVFQNPEDQMLCPTVYDELTFGLKQLGYEGEKLEKKIREIAESFHISHLLNKSPHRLSEGEKRRVILAAILSLDPETLLLDEPTADLPPLVADEIKKLIIELRNKGKTIVITTHSVDFAAEVADEVCLISKGKIIAQGDPHEILTNEELLREVDLRPPLPFVIYSLIKDRKSDIRTEKRPITIEELQRFLLSNLRK